MPISQQVTDEINLLKQFDLSSANIGLKIHSHEAAKNVVAAAERLYEKGLIDQRDGGYLTSRGHEAVQHVQALLGLLK